MAVGSSPPGSSASCVGSPPWSRSSTQTWPARLNATRPEPPGAHRGWLSPGPAVSRRPVPAGAGGTVPPAPAGGSSTSQSSVVDVLPAKSGVFSTYTTRLPSGETCRAKPAEE